LSANIRETDSGEIASRDELDGRHKPHFVVEAPPCVTATIALGSPIIEIKHITV
jgi:hypothetical protein